VRAIIISAHTYLFIACDRCLAMHFSFIGDKQNPLRLSRVLQLLLHWDARLMSHQHVPKDFKLTKLLQVN
jgi:hypothetical protein